MLSKQDKGPTRQESHHNTFYQPQIHPMLKIIRPQHRQKMRPPVTRKVLEIERLGKLSVLGIPARHLPVNDSDNVPVFDDDIRMSEVAVGEDDLVFGDVTERLEDRRVHMAC